MSYVLHKTTLKYYKRYDKLTKVNSIEHFNGVLYTPSVLYKLNISATAVDPEWHFAITPRVHVFFKHSAHEFTS